MLRRSIFNNHKNKPWVLMHLNKNLKQEGTLNTKIYDYFGKSLTYVEGKFGYGISTSNSSEQEYIAVELAKVDSSLTTLDLTQDFTFDFWVSKTDAAASNIFWMDFIVEENIVDTTIGLAFDNEVNGQQTFTLGTLSKIYEIKVNSSKWYHIALIRNNKAATKEKLFLYINGNNVIKIPDREVEMKRIYWTALVLNNIILDEIHLDNKVLYTSNFTPPTEPY